MILGGGELMANLHERRMNAIIAVAASALVVILGSAAALFAQAPTQQQQPEFVKQAQQLMKEGKPEAALAVYRQTTQTSPNSVPANIGAGSVLDLMGKETKPGNILPRQSRLRTHRKIRQGQSGRWRSPTLSKGIAARR